MSPPCSLPWQGKRCVQHEVVVVVACSYEPHFHAGARVSLVYGLADMPARGGCR